MTVPPPSDNFFLHTNHLAYLGPIDLPLIHWFDTHTGDVPAPYNTSYGYPATPRDMISAQFVHKPHFTGPATLRHRRQLADWLNPGSWPLLAATWSGDTCDLYYARFAIVPSQSHPAPSHFERSHTNEWSAFCQSADSLGFYGRDTVEGYGPFLITFSTSLTQRLLSLPNLHPTSTLPSWLQP